MAQCKLHIKMAISGQFALPKNTSLVSALYWFDNEPRCEFSHPLKVEIQHCATSSQTSRLYFARCTKNNFPYSFEFLEGGVFSTHDAYGHIQLKSFSLIALLKTFPLLTWMFGADDVKYHARLYYQWKKEDWREIHFVITKNLEAHGTVCFLNHCAFSMMV